MAHGDTGNQPVDARGLGTIELRVLQIDVVHDLRNRHESAIVETQTRHEDLEGAEVAFMRELRLEHVEAKLLCFRLVTLGRHELEAGVGVDKPANQPGARDAVNVDAFPRHPDAATEVLHTALAAFLPLDCVRRPKPRLQAAHSPLRRFTPWSTKEVDTADLCEAPPEPSYLGLDLRATGVPECSPGKLGLELPGRRGDLRVVGVSRSVEGSLHRLVG